MRRFFRYIFILSSVAMLLLSLSGGYVAYYVSNNRDTIKKLLVEQVNELTVGNWSVDSLSITILDSYPHVVVNLHNLRLYKDSLALLANEEILSIDNALFRANIPSLIGKRLNVKDVKFVGVVANLEKEADSDFNLIEALKLNNKINMEDHLFFFNIEKIDVNKVSINLLVDKYKTNKPLLVDRFMASISRKQDVINLSDCSLKCYGLNFFIDLRYNSAEQRAEIDLSSSTRLFKFKGDVKFSKTSIITVKSKIESSVPLEEYSNNKFKGNLFVKGVVDFDFDMLTNRLIDDRCRLKFGINNVLYNHELGHLPKMVLHSGIVEYSRSKIIGDKLIVGIGTNKVELNFATGSVIDLINDRSIYDIGVSADVKSTNFNPYIIKERLGILSDSTSDENSIKDLSVKFHTTITPGNLPTSLLSKKRKFCTIIDDCKVRINKNLAVSDFKGKIDIKEDSIFMRGFKGMIADSPTSFNSQIAIKNSADDDLFDRINIDADFISSHLSSHDIIEMKHRVIFNDVKSRFSAEIKPNKDRSSEQLESLKIDFKTFTATIDGKHFSQRSVIMKNRNRLEIENAKLEYDRDEFLVNGHFYLGVKNKKDTINIKTDYFDFKRFISDKSTGNTELPEVEEPIVVNLNIGTFVMLDQKLLNLKGVVCIEEDKSLLFKDVSCKVADGEVRFTGELAQSAKFLEIKCDVKYHNIDFSELSVKYQISKIDRERYVNENLRGRISGSLNADLFVDKDINIDTKRSKIDAKFTIVNGRLIDFAPIKAASKIFKNNNLNDIRFDTLSNHITVKSGVVSFPRMNIASTLGNYFVSGTTTIEDGYMDFMIEVPWNVIGGVMASKIFGGQRYNKEDIDNNVKKRYVKFQIIGKPENYEVKLRRRGDEKSNK